jgi:hypothetical protein
MEWGTSRLSPGFPRFPLDELHLVLRPVIMGSGENLFAGLDLTALGYRCTEHVSTELAMHVVLKKTG